MSRVRGVTAVIVLTFVLALLAPDTSIAPAVRAAAYLPIAVLAVAIISRLDGRAAKNNGRTAKNNGRTAKNNGRVVRNGITAAATTFATAPVAALLLAGPDRVAHALDLVPAQAAAALLVAAAATDPAAGRHSRPTTGRRARLVLAVVPLLAAFASVSPASAAAAPTEACLDGQEQRTYDVAAITLDLPYNRWGRTLTDARIFVLEQDRAAVENWWRPLAADPADDPAGNRRLRPRPLVLRANAGECVSVRLTNRLSPVAVHGMPADPRVGIDATGVVTAVAGARAGYGDDPTVGVGDSTTYLWRAPAAEGLFLFSDGAMPAGGPNDAGSLGIGLYGALAVEPAGSVWTDPRSGAVLSTKDTYAQARNQSGELYVDADIHPPGARSFRESVQLGQDEIPGVGMGFNYGAEPLTDREAYACPDCVGEETWLSSWPYGDPALIKLASGRGPWLPEGNDDRTGARLEKEDCGLPESCYVSNVVHAYNGDPTKIRFGLSGLKETHVFHLHAHQWLADPTENAATGTGTGWKPESTTVDSQSFGPGEAYTAELLFGAGSRAGTFGDSIFHCHLYPHFAEGFWSILRVHDVLLDGTGATPDGIAVRPLVPLPGRAELPRATAQNPGYPRMIPGTYGFRAPQPPNGITEGGVDGTPLRAAPRLVGGRALDAAKLAVEAAVMARNNAGKPGAPFADPCPAGAREVDFAVTVLQRDLVYNEGGYHDPQGRIMVLTKDVAAVLSGKKKPEPLFVRVNAGDCVNFALTDMAPNWIGGDAFQQLAQTNMAGGHVHLVKFDVTASDGASNGWNYQQAAFTSEQRALTHQQADGSVTCVPGEAFYGDDSTGCKIADRSEWTPPADSRGLWGQTIHERWYADYELRTAFTHDHHFAALAQNRGHYGALIVEPAGFDVRDPATGAYLQPINDASHGKVCGRRCNGTSVGEAVDLVGPAKSDDYREYALAVADFVDLVKRNGDPASRSDTVAAPNRPEPWPQEGHGVSAINYRNAPLALRDRGDPAYRFSSWVHGDPNTPLLQSYPGENVKFRVVQGSHEVQHLFQVHGKRWRAEPDDPGSPLINAQTIGISEAFNVELDGLDCRAANSPCSGDYLYGATAVDDLWNGAWGIMRVHPKLVSGLRRLPDNSASSRTEEPRPADESRARSRTAPPAADGPAASCPASAPRRTYDVVAMALPMTYDEFGDNDPRGALYTLAADEAAIRAGTKPAEPLTLRANAGDCVQVSLTNHLPQEYAAHVNGVDGDAPLLLERPSGTPMGTRVSLHPQLLRAEVRSGDGAAVGYNPDTTAGIGQTVHYEWYADRELGGTNLMDYGDVRGHRSHGLFAALIVEPKGSSWFDPATGLPLASGTAADVQVAGGADFRELTVLYQDGLDMRDASGRAIADKPDALPGTEEVEPAGAATPEGPDVIDMEDAGERAVNYRSAPLHRRLGAAAGSYANATGTAWANVFSSAAHGDPWTPVLRSYAGDDLRVRVLDGGAKLRQLAFSLQGASWAAQPGDDRSRTVGVQGGIGPGKTVNVHTRLSVPGDHRWSSATSMALSEGVWGLVRVYPRPADGTAHRAGPLRQPDDPATAGYAPVEALEPTGRPAPDAPVAVLTGDAVLGRDVTLTAAGPVYYTLDGSAPTRAAMVATGPVRVNRNRKVRAVTYDAYGTRSAETVLRVEMTGRGRTATVTSTAKPVVVLPADLRDPAGLTVAATVTTTALATVRLEAWDADARMWRPICTGQPAAAGTRRLEVDLGVPGWAVAPDGTVRVRAAAESARRSDLTVDRLAVTATAWR